MVSSKDDVMYMLDYYANKLNKLYDELLQEVADAEKKAFGRGSSRISLDERIRSLRLTPGLQLRMLDENAKSEKKGKDSHSNPRDHERQIIRARIKLKKNLALFEELIRKICINNVSSVVMGESFDWRAAKSSLLWMLTRNTGGVEKQDMERLKLAIKGLVREEMLKEWFAPTSDDPKEWVFPDEEMLDKAWVELERQFYEENQSAKAAASRATNGFKDNFDERYAGKDKSKKARAIAPPQNAYSATIENQDKLLRLFEENMVEIIDKTFNIYELASYFCTYLSLAASREIDADDYTPSRVNLMANTIVRIATRHFTSFVNIGNLEQPLTDMSNATFFNADISKSNFANSIFETTYINYSKLIGCNMSLGNFTNFIGINSNFSGSDFSYSDLSGADFSNSILNESNFRDAVFRDPRSFQYKYDLLSQAQDICRLPGIDTLFNETYMQEYENISACKKRLLRSLENLSEKENRTDTKSPEWICTTCRLETDDAGKFCIENQDFILSEIFNSLQKTCQLYVSCYRASVIHPKIKEYFENRAKNMMLLSNGAANELLVKVNYRSAKLRNANVKGAALTQMDLSFCDMEGATFDDSDLSHSRMYYSAAKNANLNNANLNQVVVFESFMSHATATNALLIDSVFVNTELTGVNFTNAIMLNAKLINSTAPLYLQEIIKNSDDKRSKTASFFDNIDDPALDDIEFTVDDRRYNINLIGSIWNKVNATEAVLIGWNLDRAQFISSEYSNSKWINCIARWASFRNANMPYSIFIGVSLHRSNTCNVNFSKARFFASEFSGVQMTGSICIGARFDKVIFNEASLDKVNFSDARFFNCVFSNVKFSNVNLFNAEFYNVVFDNVDFSGCIDFDTALFYKCYNTAGEFDLTKSLGNDYQSHFEVVRPTHPPMARYTTVSKIREKGLYEAYEEWKEMNIS